MAFINSTAAAVFGSNSADTINSSNINGSFSRIYGGLGNDFYFIDAFYFDSVNGNTPADVVIEALGGGLDTVRLDMFGNGTSGNGDFTLYDNVENLEASLSTSSFDNFTLTGNNLANKISITSSTGSTYAFLNGLAGNDTLIGGFANDELVGGTGIDSMVGGDGSDTYYVDNVLDQVIENAGADNDYVYSSVSFTLGANVESLELQSSSNINGTGNVLNNYLYGNSGNNALNGLAGDDDLRGGEGNDTLNGGAGNDALRGNAGNDSLNGGDGDDLLVDGDGNDTQLGGAGNDRLYGNYNSAFIDKLDGGAGDDTYRLYSANDVVTDTGVGGNDTVRAHVQLTGDLGAGIENLELFSYSGAISGRGNALNNTITGNGFNNSLFGLAGNDYLYGYSGNDILDGGAGNDTLVGSLGNDLMRGGDGNDTYFVDSDSDAAVETNASSAVGGIDTVFSSLATYTLGANLENITLLSGAISATGNTLANKIIGNSADNTLTGGDGNDTLYGGLGAGIDSLIGGNGDDVFIVDDALDIVQESALGGTDRVESSAYSYTLSAEIENLTLIGSGVRGYGNSLANTIKGNIGNNTIDGGLGADTMSGGLGNDTYVVDVNTDIIIELAGQGIDTVESSLITASLALLTNVENLTLTGAAINGIGNALNNVIGGNASDNSLVAGAGNDSLNGGAGADTLVGGIGNDTYTVDVADDVVTELAAAGNDTLISSRAASIDLSVGQFSNIENAELTDIGNFNIIGNAAANKLTGGAGANSLVGGAGDDTLNGGAGIDTLVGGTGNDVFIVDSITDIIDELSAGGGIDRVESSVSFSLVDTDGLLANNGGNVENLTLTGSGNINGAGNNLANFIKGNSGNNSLTGGIGIDTLNGGAGDDIYYVDNQLDIVVESAVNGYDHVFSTVTFTLGANVDDLGLQGTNNINGTGNTLNNELDGNDGNNTLNGLAGNDRLNGYAGNDVLNGGDGNDNLYGAIGNDTLNGGAGNDNLLGNGNSIFIDKLDGGAGDDFYRLYSANDVVTDTGVGGNDTVQAHVQLTGDLGAGIENLELYWMGIAIAIEGRGNALNNLITGNGNNNILFGLAGNDNLNGDSGADTLIGGLGNDVFFVDDIGDVVDELAGLGSGSDRVESSITYSLVDTDGVGTNGGNVENLTLTGTADINGTGNIFANTINGNAGDNELIGDAGNDTLIGGLGNDTINGGVGVDSMVGGAGDDLYYVNSGLDIVIEGIGAGDDFVYSSASFTLGANIEKLKLDSLGGNINGTGNALANRIYGNSGNNIISGLGGNDYSSGGFGNDVLNGGDGNDDLRGGGDNDTLNGGAGNDQLNGGIGTNKLDGGAGNDLYVIYSASDIISDTGIGGSDTLLTHVQLIGDLGAGIEQLELYSNASIITGRGNVLNNFIYGNNFNNSLFGLAGNDYLIGQSGADTLDGGAGNDTLDGGLGDDSMTGGDGNDTYFVDSTLDVVVETNASSVTGGIDTVFSSASTFTLGSNIEKLTLSGAAITGNGNTLANTIIGNDANNSIDGGDGNDTLNGGAGIDTLIGGLGDDTYHVDNAFDVLNETGGSGIDAVFTSVSFSLLNQSTGNVENLTITGTANDIAGSGNSIANTINGNNGNDILIGFGGNDTLIGGLGNDYLYGGTGADSMVGGAGDDEYYVDDAGDIVTELAGQGVDIVYYTGAGTYTLGATVENLSLDSAANAHGIGNALDNAINGYGGNNSIAGGLGNDFLNGGDGNDTIDGGDGLDVLDGGNGDDSMRGGLGNDTYIVDSANDTVVETNLLGSGIDTVFSSAATFTLGANVENLTLTGIALIDGTGNTLANKITGNSANNSIDGGAGNDTLNGGLGADNMNGGADDDVYIVDNAGDVVQELALGGTDRVESSVNIVLNNPGELQIENITLTGTDNINADGNDLNNMMIGNSGVNYLYGGGGSDTLRGGLGDDELEGGTGIDSMVGGLGNDLYYVDVAGDIVVELAGQGTDIVRYLGTGAYTLGASVENLTLSTVAATNGTGNALNNIIQGNSNNNVLSGAAGNDELLGLNGADALNGGDGNDTLNGGAGIDNMTGGLGNDTYFKDDAGDVINEVSASGNDTLIYQLAGALSLTTGSLLNIENATLANAAGTDITGNGLANKLTGNAGINSLIGGAGNDTLDGGLGVDMLIGGLGNDVFIVDNALDVVQELAGIGSGIDRVESSITYSLASSGNVEDLTLTGVGLINGYGNTLNNVIKGNSGNNDLFGDAGTDTLSGGAGSDTLDGGSGLDSMVGGLGDDYYYVDVGGDIVVELAGQGIDTVYSTFSFSLAALGNIENLDLEGIAAINGTGNALDNYIQGNGSANILNGGAGNDYIFGEGGADTLIGGLGNDTLDGGFGSQRLEGGLGNDVFRNFNGFGSDIITDFVSGFDSLSLAGFGAGLSFTGAGNSLLADQFKLSTQLLDADDRIIYNQTTGDLFYDADGSGAIVQQHIINFTGVAPALSSADIFA